MTELSNDQPTLFDPYDGQVFVVGRSVRETF